MHLNDKAQEFDVFKLVIAAIVAVAILAVLMGILSQLNIFGSDVEQTTKQTLQKALSAHAFGATSSKITFKPENKISNTYISGQSNGALSKDMISFNTGQMDNKFVATETMLSVKGGSPVEARIWIYCNNKGEQFDTELNEEWKTKDTDPDLESTNCTTDDELCCIIAIKRPA